MIPGRSVLLEAVCRLLLGILGCSGQCQCDAGKAGRFPSCLGSFWAATERGWQKGVLEDRGSETWKTHFESQLDMDYERHGRNPPWLAGS